ncbi:MAG: hypothetical protein IPL39_09070 [Opitutaceae bacterium]|nr:hypothetical protein [Opitutaceae bacterium]
MKTLFPASGFALLAGFAVFSTGCVAQYESPAPVVSYSDTTLPAAGSVALVMEFRGGEPTPEERADVRAILADYFAQQGTVIVEDASAADYIVHAVMERRNPENPAEWTVVETYSANSLRSAGSDEFRWPGGLVEDDYYEPTTYSYVGFGLFYPVFFDLWSNPWHRGHVILRPPPRHHNNWNNDRWRADHRWHRPTRWQPDRHPEWKNRDRHRDRDRRPDPNRRDHDRRPDANRRDNDSRPGDDRRGSPDRRPRPDHGRAPSVDTPRHLSPGAGNVQRPDHGPRPVTGQRPPSGGGVHQGPAPTVGHRPSGGGDHRPDHVRPPNSHQPRPVAPGGQPAHHESFVGPQPQPAGSTPAVRQDRPRRGGTVVPGHGVIVTPPQTHQQPANRPEPARVQPADRRAGSPAPVQPGNRDHRQPSMRDGRERVRETPPPSPAPQSQQVSPQRREAPRGEQPRTEPRRGPDNRQVTPAPNRSEGGRDRRSQPRDPDKEEADKDRQRK